MEVDHPQNGSGFGSGTASLAAEGMDVKVKSSSSSQGGQVRKDSSDDEDAQAIIRELTQLTNRIRENVIRLLKDWSDLKFERDVSSFLVATLRKRELIVAAQKRLRTLAEKLETAMKSKLTTPLDTNPLAILPWSPPSPDKIVRAAENLEKKPDAREKIKLIGASAKLAANALERYAAKDSWQSPCLAIKMAYWKRKFSVHAPPPKDLDSVLTDFRQLHPENKIRIRKVKHGGEGLLMELVDVCYMFISFRGHDGSFKVEGVVVSGWGEGAEAAIDSAGTRALVFRRISEQCNVAIHNLYQAVRDGEPLTVLVLLLDWLASYTNLFTAKCLWCLRHRCVTSDAPDRVDFLPPIARTLPGGRPFHPRCREASRT